MQPLRPFDKIIARINDLSSVFNSKSTCSVHALAPNLCTSRIILDKRYIKVKILNIFIQLLIRHAKRSDFYLKLRNLNKIPCGHKKILSRMSCVSNTFCMYETEGILNACKIRKRKLKGGKIKILEEERDKKCKFFNNYLRDMSVE